MDRPEIFTLRIGIRVVHNPMNREVGHCGLFINGGSRDEHENEHGLAHFLEHCLFKGTKHRKTFHILSRLDSVGGELNAFTSKEETWIHASFLTEHFERAIELIADIAFYSTFPEKEIAKEKEVILDEINSYKDSPSEMIFEEFDQQLFGKHPIGRSILGTEESLKTFRKKNVLEFWKRNFTSDNLIFSSVGNIPVVKLRALMEKYIEPHHIPAGSIERVKFKGYRAKNIEVKKDIHQVHTVLGTIAYDYPHKKRPGLSLLNNILGGPAMNNRLSLNIREKYGIAYSIDSSYAPFTDTGIFSIYLGTEKNNLDKSWRLIWKELNTLKEKELSARQLRDAKKQIIGQMALAQDSGGSIMFNIGKSLMLFDRVDSMEEVYENIDEITSRELRDIANEIFDEARMSSLTYTY
ncbi:MAG: insulinase family protein [Crocinitomicaceae bacterium]|nr:insulinase family protein [Crocinitomicaceae bacterium]